MKSLFFSFIMVVGQSVLCQNNNLYFISTDASNFQVTIDRVKQNDVYTDALLIQNIEGEQYYEVQLRFEKDTNVLTKQIYLIGEYLNHICHIEKNQINLKKIIPIGIDIPKVKNLLTMKYLKGDIGTPKTKPDTLPTISQKPQNNHEKHYNMPNYDGRVGCNWPIKEEVLIALQKKINAETLEDDKLFTAKQSVQEFDTLCFTMEQVKRTALLLEYEESRIDFILHMTKKIFDVDNYPLLKDIFNFEDNFNKIKERMRQNTTTE